METSTSTEPASKPANNNIKNKKALNILKWASMVIFLIAIGASAGYFYRDHTAKNNISNKDSQITSLQSQLSTAQKDLAAAKKSASTTASSSTTATAPTSVTPSATVLANLHDSITSGNTQALEGYMATTVRVIIAASEGMGNRTAAQATSDITTWLTNTTSPWSFSLPASTLSSYRAGSYAQYFPTTAYIGKSNNGYVISFQFDANSKVSGVFLAAPGVL